MTADERLAAALAALADVRVQLASLSESLASAERAIEDCRHDLEVERLEVLRLAYAPDTPPLAPDTVPEQWVARWGDGPS